MITAEQLSYDQMQHLARTHKCGKCGGMLNVAWVNGQYVLRCADLSHDTITRHDAERDKRIAEIKEVRGLDSKSLMVMPESKMLERVNAVRWPKDLTPDQKKMLANVATSYGFDPLMGELMIYQGAPYVRIDGRRRKAQESGELDGIQTRPATKVEREAREIPDGDLFFHADVWRKGASRPFEGWGRVLREEIDRAIAASKAHDNDPWFLPLVKDPGDIAEKRAEAEALKRGFSVPLPSAEDIIGRPEVPFIRASVERTPGSGHPPIDIKSHAESGCPKCGVVCETWNDEDVKCSGCGVPIHWKNGKPYIGEAPTSEEIDLIRRANPAKATPGLEPAKVTHSQRAEMFAIIQEKGVPDDVITKLLADRSVTNSKDLTFEKAVTMLADLKAWKPVASK